MAKGTSRPRGSGGRPSGRQGGAGSAPRGAASTGGTGKATKHTGKTKPAKPSKKCCPMVAALVSVKRRHYRLASRYARLSLRLIAGRIA